MPGTITRTRAGDRAGIDRPMPRATRRPARWWEPVARVASALTAAPPARPGRDGSDEPCDALVIDLPDDEVPAAFRDDAEEPCYALVVDVPDEPDDATGGRVLLFPPRPGHPGDASPARGRDPRDPLDARARSARAHPAGGRSRRPDDERTGHPVGARPACSPGVVDAPVADEAGPAPTGSVTADELGPAEAPDFDQDAAADLIGDVVDDGPGAAPRPEVDPRIRARRVAIRRAEGRRRLRFMVAALAAVTVAVVLVTTHAFGEAGPPAPAARPVAVGWIVVPAPKGGSGGPSVAVVDGSGAVMQRALLPPAGLPRLAATILPGSDGARISPVAVAQVARILPTDLRARAATLEVRRGLVTMGLDQGPEIRFGTPDGLAVKGRTAFAILSALRTSVHYIDVRVPSAPVTG